MDAHTLSRILMKDAAPSRYFEEERTSGKLRRDFPEAAALIGVRQDPSRHPEGDAYVHTMMVLDAAAGLRPQAARPEEFMLAALCHDYGKALTMTVGSDGKLEAPGHAEAGVPLTHAFLIHMGYAEAVSSYVENMVLLHMDPNNFARRNEDIHSCFRLFRRSVCPEDLLLLAKADYLGNGVPAPYDDTERWLRERLLSFRSGTGA